MYSEYENIHFHTLIDRIEKESICKNIKNPLNKK